MLSQLFLSILSYFIYQKEEPVKLTILKKSRQVAYQSLCYLFISCLTHDLVKRGEILEILVLTKSLVSKYL